MNYPSTSLPYLIIVIIIMKNNNSDDSNIDLLVENPRGGPSCPLFPSRIGSWKCWFLRREENRRPGETPPPPGARTRTNKKLKPHVTPGTRIESRPQWYRWEMTALTIAPSLLPAPMSS